MTILEISFASGESSLSVHRFAVREAVSALFAVSLTARSSDPGIDLGAIVGQRAVFRSVAGHAHVHQSGARRWGGVVSHAEQTHALQLGAGETGLSTYQLTLVPALWLLTRRRGNRIYQHLSIPDIIDRLLGEWSLQPVWNIDRGRYPKLEYKVQYAETDYHFFSRLLEEAGIAFTFADDEAQGSALTLSDRLEASPPRPGAPIRYVDNPSQAAEQELVTNVRIGREVLPGAFAIRDADFRNPAFALFGEAPPSPAPEDRLEQYHYDPGAFLVETGKPGSTPVADDQGFARHDPKYAQELAEHGLHGERVGARGVSLNANTYDLAPGVVFAVDNHPHPELPAGRKILVVESLVEGSPDGEWTLTARAVFADAPYRPPRRTPRPVVHGLQSATVVGPKGQEIHTDEHGRIRVQFPWDREGRKDEHSSCWVRVHEAWGGAGYGMITLPRVGQEVLVTFLNGDPDQPAVVGRAYNGVEQVPYKLPAHRTRSSWKSDSSLGSDGFNEIMFEDLKGKELVWEQAQKDRQRLVKNDEQSTVVHDRQKLVKNDESDRTEGMRQRWVGKDADAVTKQHRRERIEGDSHIEVRGGRRELILGMESLTVVLDQHERVEGRQALRAAKQVHYAAGEEFVAEAADDVTIQGPGGFIRMDAGGITISGTLVKINVGGSPGKGLGSHPELLLAVIEAAEAVLASAAESMPEEVTKADRVARRSALIASARARAEWMEPGSAAREKLAGAADRLERNNRAVEMAKLSQYVYKDESEPENAPEGWTRLSRDELPPGLRDQVWEDKDSGFAAAMFRSDDGKMVLAYRGTDERKDWKANLPQGLGFETTQYNQAHRLAQAVRNTYGPGGFEVTGHSLGGGLASFASVTTGAPATIFNAAGLHPKTARRVGADLSDADGLIESYHVEGELLTSLQSVPGAREALGKRYNLPMPTSMSEIVGKGASKGGAIGGAVAGPKGVLLGGAMGGLVSAGKESYNRHGIEHAVNGIETQKKEDMQAVHSPGGK